MLVMHGAVYLQMRTEDDINTRAKKKPCEFSLSYF
jgi:cytochrome bd-type quinol oxidase subunit 2